MNTTTRTIGSGIKVAIAEMADAPLVAIEIAIRAGPLYESQATNGLSHLLEHMIFRGTETLPSAQAHARALDALATHEAATEPDRILVWLKVAPDAFEDAIALVGQMIRQPSFDGLEAEKEVVVHELFEDLDDLDGRQADPANVAASLLFAGHPLGLLVTGDGAHIRGFTLAQLRQHHARHCVGANIAIAVAGDVDPQSAFDTIEVALFGLPIGERLTPPAPPEPKQTRGAQVRIGDGGTTYADVCVALRGVGREHDGAAACEVLARLLDGRPSALLYELRAEHGRFYRCSAEYAAFAGTGHLEIVTRIRADQAVRVLSEILGILERLACDGPDAELMAIVRRELEREALAARYDATQVASALAAALLDGEEPDDDPTNVDDLLAVTASEVRDAARMLVRPEALTVVCLGDLKKAERARLQAVIGQWRGPRIDEERAPGAAAE